MKTIKLPYGKGTLDLNIPEERLAEFLNLMPMNLKQKNLKQKLSEKH